MRIAPVLVGALLGGALLGCSDDGETVGPTIYDTWRITKYEYVNDADSTQSVDLVAEGLTGTIALNADATWVSTTTRPGAGTQTVRGTWQFSSTSLTLRQGSTGVEWTFDMVVGTNTLTLTGASAEYDFGGGTPVPATWNVTLTRP
jgi:hypothetical protein